VVDGHRTNAHLGGPVTRAEIGHERFHHEGTVGPEPCLYPLEEALLFAVADQIEDGVVGDQHRVERAVGEVVDHVAEDRLDPTVDVTFGELGEHRLAAVDADDLEARIRHRHREPSGADPEFEHSPVRASEFDDARHGCRDVGDIGVPLVVHVGEPIAVRTSVVSPHHRETTADYP